MPEQAAERGQGNGSAPGAANLSPEIEKAYELLQEANRRSIQVPSGVIVALTEAREAWVRDRRLRDYTQEVKFWNAYGLLSGIEPTERARRTYMTVFIISFSALLSCQLYYACGTSVEQKLTQIDKEYTSEIRGLDPVETARPASSTPAADSTNPPASGQNGSPAPPTRIEAKPGSPSQSMDQAARIRRDRLVRVQAYYHMERRLIGHFDHDPTLPSSGSDADQVASAREYWSEFQISIGLLNLYLLFMAQYILPILYGLLGACAFVLRRLSDPIGELAYAHRLRVRYTLRLFIGPLAGVASGLLVNSTSSTPGLVGLSPLAIAFCAGYSSHILFFMLDKVVSPFLAPVGSDGSSRTETTVSGLTMTTAMQRETHMQGSPISAAGSRVREDAARLTRAAQPSFQG